MNKTLNIMSYGKQKYLTKVCCGSHRPGASSGRLRQSGHYIKLPNHENYLNFFFISSNNLFRLLGSAEGNQKSEKQIQKGKLNKAIKSRQKN